MQVWKRESAPAWSSDEGGSVQEYALYYRHTRRGTGKELLVHWKGSDQGLGVQDSNWLLQAVWCFFQWPPGACWGSPFCPSPPAQRRGNPGFFGGEWLLGHVDVAFLFFMCAARDGFACGAHAREHCVQLWVRWTALVTKRKLLFARWMDCLLTIVAVTAGPPLLVKQTQFQWWETPLFVFPPPSFFCINVKWWTRAFIFDTCWRNFFLCERACVPWQCGAFCHDTQFFFLVMLDDLMRHGILCAIRKKKWKGKQSVCLRDENTQKKKIYQVLPVRWYKAEKTSCTSSELPAAFFMLLLLFLGLLAH